MSLLEDLGKAKRVEIGKDNTTFISGAGGAENIQNRIRKIHDEIEKSANNYDREKFQERAARLALKPAYSHR